MGYKKKENHRSLDGLKVPDTLTAFINELPIRYQDGEIGQEVEHQVDQEWNTYLNRLKQEKGRLRKKIVIYTGSVAAACCIFIGAAFFSPSVAHVVAKIPYLNLRTDYKPLIEEIGETIREKGYKHGQDIIISVDNTKKKVTVTVIESKEYFDKNKGQLENLVEDILNSRNNDDFKIVMKNDPETAKLIDQYMEEHAKEVFEETKERDKVKNVLRDVLKKYGYDKDQVTLGSEKGEIQILNIPVTETRIEEMKREVLDTLREAQMEDYYSVKVNLYDPVLVERGTRLMQIYTTIHNGLTAKTDVYKVDSVGFSNKDHEPFYMEVRTTVPNSHKDINNILNNIEKTIGEFLQSKEAQEKLKEDKYKIVIEDKDGNVMNVIKN